MAPKALPSQEVLRQLLRYDPATGKLFWRPRTPENCKRAEWFNARFAEREAFTTENRYRTGIINGVSCFAHRVVWKMHHGVDPTDCYIDHINRVKTDNRIENLRLATGTQNQANVDKRPHRSSKFKGVCRVARGKWQGTLRKDGVRFHLGTFNCQTAAALAYDLAAIREFGEFAVTNQRQKQQ